MRRVKVKKNMKNCQAQIATDCRHHGKTINSTMQIWLKCPFYGRNLLTKYFTLKATADQSENTCTVKQKHPQRIIPE